MKCTGISTKDSSADTQTLQEFKKSEYAETPFGQLLIALTGETDWSREYSVYARFGTERTSLNIRHEALLPDCSLYIEEGRAASWTVADIEEAVRTHLKDSYESIRPAINILQIKQTELNKVGEKIDTDKARAAITRAFPGIGELVPTADHSSGLYAFTEKSSDLSKGPIYVARKVGNDFTGGIVRLNVSAYSWHSVSRGIRSDQKHGLFWTALAKTFAACELGVPLDGSRVREIATYEHPFSGQQPNQAAIEKVVLHDPSQGANIVVEFAHNMPAKAYVVVEERSVANS